MNSGKVLFGVFAGAVTGVTLGILFAPNEGSKTRKQISKKVQDYLDNLKCKFDDYVQNASDTVEDVEKEGKNLADKGKAKVEELKHELENNTGEKISTKS